MNISKTLGRIGRFTRRPRAHVRYWGWLAHWHLSGHWVTDNRGRHWRQWWFDDMDYSTNPWSPKHPRMHKFVGRFRQVAGKVRGPYSHRSDFTDPESGVLHGGKGWSEEAFETFVKNISLE